MKKYPTKNISKLVANAQTNIELITIANINSKTSLLPNFDDK